MGEQSKKTGPGTLRRKMRKQTGRERKETKRRRNSIKKKLPRQPVEQYRSVGETSTEQPCMLKNMQTRWLGLQAIRRLLHSGAVIPNSNLFFFFFLLLSLSLLSLYFNFFPPSPPEPPTVSLSAWLVLPELALLPQHSKIETTPPGSRPPSSYSL